METLRNKTTPFYRPQVGVQEYLLVAPLNKKLSEKIKAEKESFAQTFFHKDSFQSTPNLVIAKFNAREEMEETMVRYMQRIIMQQNSFEVALNNYSGFPLSTIYLRVQNQQPFRRLIKELKVVGEYVSSCFCPPIEFTSTPHIVIAKNLPDSLYLKAMMHYSQKTFHETFLLNELKLVRRNSEFDAEKSINVFGMRPSENTLYN